MDSELRFYAPLFGAYGMLMLWTAQDLFVRNYLIPWLAAVFFLGGLGRVLSYAAVGAPHPLFVVLMAIELLMPPVLVGLWFMTKLH
jgi:hypothetical protein